jgi:type IV secretion system protein VirD4
MCALFFRLILAAACIGVAAAIVVVGVQVPPLGCLGLAYLAWRKLRRWKGSGWSHGTARWAELGDLARCGLLGERGLILGRADTACMPRMQTVWQVLSPRVPSDMAVRGFFAAFLGSRFDGGRLIRLSSYVHLATFAPTGRGKGVSVILPNLLAHPGSVVITDPKGENYQITAAHRSKRFGHRAIRLDPFGICGSGSDTFNPLSCIDAKADDFLDLCRDVANMLVVRQGTEHEPHWNDAAELVLTAFIAFTCACTIDPAKRNLHTVRGLVSSREAFTQAVATMRKSAVAVVQRLGDTLSWFQDKELSSVLTTVQRHTQFLDSPAIARNSMVSSFDPRELRGGKRSLYLIVPPDRLGTLAPLMRMWIGMTVRTLARGGTDERRPVLFLIDEAAHLGKIQVLEDAVTLMRGMGIRLWFFFQSLDQLKACYGDKADVFLDNFDTTQYFGTNAYAAAEAISLRIGEFTLTTVSYNENRGWSRSEASVGKDAPAGSYSGGSSYTASDMARRLIKPEEILCLPSDTALVLHRNMPVIAAKLLRYFDAPEFRRGGCGETRGIGLAASVLAMLTLAASAVMLGAAVSLPPASTWQVALPAREPDAYPPDYSGLDSDPLAPLPYQQPAGYDRPPRPLPYRGGYGRRFR